MKPAQKTVTIQIRLTEAEKSGMVEAAEIVGVSLSSWVRQKLRSAAIRDLEGTGRRAPFIASIPMGGNANG